MKLELDVNEALIDLLDAVETAIKAGDWKVDGACDPDLAIRRAKQSLAQPEQEPVTDRENAIIRFALHRFMSNAYMHMNAAAQDKENRSYQIDAVEKFAKDAKDAEALLSRLRFTTPPQRKPLTEEELSHIYEEYHDCYGQPINANENWAYERAIEAAHGIKGDA